MAQLQVQISVEDNRVFAQKLKDAIGKALREKFDSSAQERATKEVDRAVRQSRVEFIPSNDEAAELGVGENGRFSKKIDTAWEGLLPSRGTATIVNVSRGVGNEIGRISVVIDWDTFYSLEDSRINASDSDIGEIPWMEWYIEGKSISGSRFKAGKFNMPPSRTGAGIMIPGSLWEMPPHPIGPVELQERIVANLTKLAEKLSKGR